MGGAASESSWSPDAWGSPAIPVLRTTDPSDPAITPPAPDNLTSVTVVGGDCINATTEEQAVAIQTLAAEFGVDLMTVRFVSTPDGSRLFDATGIPDVGDRAVVARSSTSPPPTTILLWGVADDRPLAAMRSHLRRLEVPVVFVDQRAVGQSAVTVYFDERVEGRLTVPGRSIDLDNLGAAYLRPSTSRGIDAVSEAGPGSALRAHAAVLTMRSGGGPTSAMRSSSAGRGRWPAITRSPTRRV